MPVFPVFNGAVGGAYHYNMGEVRIDCAYHNNLREVRIGGAPQNNLHTSFRPAGLEHPKQLAYLVPPRRVRAPKQLTGYY